MILLKSLLYARFLSSMSSAAQTALSDHFLDVQPTAHAC